MIGAALAVLAATPAPGAESVVYYQVTYANGKLRDLAVPPTTHKGIRRVLRISRIDGPIPGLSVLSTGADGVSFVRSGRTVRGELRWDGRAWVGQGRPKAPRLRPATRPAGRLDGERQAGRAALARKVKAQLQAEQGRLKTCEQAVVQAAEVLAKAKGTDGEKPAMLLLTQAQAARQESLKRIVQLEGLLSDLAPAEAGPAAAGTVAPAGPAEGRARPLGVAKPAAGRRVLPHRVQVWRLPRGRGRRTYQVSMAHPEAGRHGGFHYVAYADTDADGQPDTLIARSPLAVADRPGGWTRWRFATDADAVFAGNAWPHADAVQYYCPADGHRENWRGLGTEVYVSGLLGGKKFHKWPLPYFTNLRVRVADQNPD